MDFTDSPSIYSLRSTRPRWRFISACGAPMNGTHRFGQLARESAAGAAIEVERDGVPYVFSRRSDTALEVLRRG
ncbi:hypothetical protein A8144_05055 [Mycobacterium leprae 3125609]|nr:hypothetical protein A8144_05055 [Mycobacterium leprae 3125609]OAX71780.1 hypothetical protein A3216_03780 [Mycobacterium leprae 7935681]